MVSDHSLRPWVRSLCAAVACFTCFGGTLVACKSEATDTKPAAETAESKPADQPVAAEPTPKAAAEPGAKAATGEVEVAKAGTKFDPPVKTEQIPQGAWMCDMGTVHYASMDKGDGKCPTCGMNLTQKGAEGEAAEGDEHEDHGH